MGEELADLCWACANACGGVCLEWDVGLAMLSCMMSQVTSICLYILK